MQKECSYYSEVALVLSSAECGLAVIRSLGEDPRIKVISLGKKNQPGTVSKYLYECYYFDSYDKTEIIGILKQINDKYSKIIPIPAGNDFWVKILADAKDELNNFVFSFNENIHDLMSKAFQKQICEKDNIPYPASVIVRTYDDLKKADELSYPVIVKPFRRNTKDEVFRNKIFFENETMLKEMKDEIGKADFLMSEYIEGPDSELYTFGSYAHQGKVVSDFSGRKLTQKPMGTGTAGLAEGVEGVFPFQDDSIKFLKACGFSGISQIEYKRSGKDGLFYFMEFNPRSWLWIYLATAEGINLPLAEYYTLTNREDMIRSKDRSRHKKYLFVSGRSIVSNTFKQGNFAWLKFLLQRVSTHEIVYAVKNREDMAPYKKALKNKNVGSKIKKFLLLFKKGSE